MKSRFLLVIVALLIALPLSAVVYRVPSDETLIRASHSAVVGTVVASETRVARTGGFETVFTIAVQESLKGENGETMRVVVPGGRIGTRFHVIPGAPDVQTGDRLLLLTTRRNDGALTPLGFGLGVFHFATSNRGTSVLTRSIDGVLSSDGTAVTESGERLRAAERFAHYVKATASGRQVDARYFVDGRVVSAASASKRIDAHADPAAYLIEFGNLPAKWFSGNIVFHPTGALSGSATSDVQNGMNAWSGNSGGAIAISLGGVDGTYEPFGPNGDDGKNSIVVNAQAGTDFPGGGEVGGVIAFAALYGDLGNASFNRIVESDIFLGEIPGGVFRQTIAHEFGHSLGFRHSDAGTPNDPNAVMQSHISGAYDQLQCWDLDAVHTVYGGTSSCTGPPSVTGPNDESIGYNESATLSADTTTCGVSFQWYEGTAPDASKPMPGANGKTFSTPLLKSTTNYWVKVVNACGPTASRTATVSVAACNPATIPAAGQPQNKQINPGSSTSLQVSANGTAPLQFQWFKGASGDTTMPIPGGNASTLNTGVLNATTSYWVRVSNDCGTVFSNTATVTVGTGCVAPSITAEPVAVTIDAGKTTTLTVAAGGTNLTYQWFEGQGGDTSKPVNGATNASFTTPALNATTTYWVKVSNTCGSVNSKAVTVTVRNACIPSITSQPASTQVSIGRSATLTVAALGDNLSYQWYRGTAPDTSNPVAGANGATFNTPPLGETTSFWVRVSNTCGSVDSATAVVTAVCGTPDAPTIAGPGEVVTGQNFTIKWTALPGVSHYELQESTNADFTGAVTTTHTNAFNTFTKNVTAATRFFYRVRATASCNGSVSPFSTAINVAVVLPPTANDLDPNATVPEGSTKPVTFTLTIMPPAGSAKTLDTTYSVSTDKSWLTATPASGTVPPSGTTVTITGNPTGMTSGTNTGTVTVTNGGTTTSIPISINVVTAVTPDPKSAATSQALIIPVVGHADGANGSKFLSDIRITNISNQKLTYELSYTPTASNGTLAGKKTRIDIGANETKAFNDVVKNWFGLGSTGDSAIGVLDIRPVSSVPSNAKATVASSRTYNLTQTGTFGQYIPAISFASFVGKPDTGLAPRISLQQVAESTLYRTNFGIVEGSGQAVTVMVTLYNSAGAKLVDHPMNLAAFEHRQFRLQTIYPTSFDDGRIEVVVTGGTGKVTAYASVVDNRTNDPLLVSPVVVNATLANRYVVPGVADINSATNSWRSDVRLFNSGDAPVAATLTFIPQAGLGGSVQTRQVNVPAHQVVPLDNLLQQTFSLSNTGGALQVSTANNAPLVVSARTYDDQKTAGTYGQFIPAVTAADATGLGDRTLDVLQIEESDRFRTNLGLVEVTGNGATVEITVYVPDAKSAPSKQYFLNGNEFLQIGRILDTQFGLKPSYNARVTVRVVGGSGRVAAYASVIDNKTQDPTYVPAQ